MPRSSTVIKKGDVERAIAGARAGGIDIARVEIDKRDQRIIIFANDSGCSARTDLDVELAAFEARHEGKS